MSLVSLNIEDREYRLLPMAPAIGAHFAARVGVLLGSVLSAQADDLASLVGAFKGEQDIENAENQQKLIRMVLGFLPNIDPDKFSAICAEALNYECYAGGTKLSAAGHLDKWFADHKGDYFPVAIWAIREHCKDFFVKGGPAWSAMVGNVIPSKSQKTAK